MSRRAFLLVMDSLGIGAAADAARFGDEGGDTFGHIAEACAAGKADKPGLRAGPLRVPNLARLGFVAAAEASRGAKLPLASPAPTGWWGFAAEHSHGKDTPSGHWEMAGVPVMFDWGYFQPEFPSFPAELTDALIAECKLPGLLGNCAASGTEIIEQLGVEHIATGKPIVYTSADSVFQIAAHEQAFGLERLYEVCHAARRLVDPYNIGRVIARPFVGTPGAFRRTGNRHDYAVPPPEPTLLDHLVEQGRQVVAIGKISDIFAARGVSRYVRADGNEALMDATLVEARGHLGEGQGGDLIFTNFVDFDTLFGHRRDIPGYAAAIEAFDARLPELEAALRPGDIALLTADHGCDPSFRGTDHTREHIPIVAFGPGLTPRALGRRDGFADIGQTLAGHLGLAPLAHGRSFLA